MREGNRSRWGGFLATAKRVANYKLELRFGRKPRESSKNAPSEPPAAAGLSLETVATDDEASRSQPAKTELGTREKKRARWARLVGAATRVASSKGDPSSGGKAKRKGKRTPKGTLADPVVTPEQSLESAPADEGVVQGEMVETQATLEAPALDAITQEAIETAPEAPQAPETAEVPEPAPGTRELWGMVFDISDRGLAEDQVVGFVSQLVERYDALARQQKASAELSRTVQEVMEEVNLKAEEIRASAHQEAEAEAAQIIARAKEEAQATQVEASAQAADAAAQQVEAILRDGHAKAKTIEADATTKAQLILEQARDDLTTSVREVMDEVQKKGEDMRGLSPAGSRGRGSPDHRRSKTRRRYDQG